MHTFKLSTVVTNNNLTRQIVLNRYKRVIASKNVSKLVVDFSETGHLSPFHIAAFGCLIEEYSQNAIEVEFLHSGNAKTERYLNAIKFYNYWTPNFDRDRFTNTANTALCLWHISNEMITQYANEAQSYFERHFFDGISLEPLSIALGEIFNNIFDHSNSEIQGYVFTQYYPNLNRIRTSVCDFGDGIPNVIRRANPELSDTEALEMAFKKGFSTHSKPHNRGFGLDTLMSITKASRGTLTILSNNAYYHQYSLGRTVLKNNNISFPGTLLYLDLDSKNLPQMEIEIDNDEFFF